MRMHWQGFSPAGSTDATNRPPDRSACAFHRARCFFELTGTIPFGNEISTPLAPASTSPPSERTNHSTPFASRCEPAE